MANIRKPVNILVVDDEHFFAEWLAENLQDMPQRYNAHWVNSGERALEFIGQKPVDLVISDIKMAGVSGIELLNQIRTQRPDVGVILMTGYALPELQQDAVKRGSLLYLEKPFPLEKLETAIEQALSTRPGSEEPKPEPIKPLSPQLSLIDTLHLFHLSRSTKTLLVKSGSVDGLIYYQDGEVVHAVGQSSDGEAAFSQIMSWDSNDYEVFSDEPPPNRTINREFDSLLKRSLERVSFRPEVAVAEHLDTLSEGPELGPPLPVEHDIVAERESELPGQIQAGVTDLSAIMKEPELPDWTQTEQTQPPAPESTQDITVPVYETTEFASELTAPSDLQEPIEEATAPTPSEVPTVVPESPNEERTQPLAIIESAESVTATAIDLPSVMIPLPELSTEARRELQELLLGTEHLEGGALLTAHGAIIASTMSQHLLTPALITNAGDLLKMCQHISQEFGRGNHRQSFIQGEKGDVVVSEVGAGSYLLFVTSAKATLGLALLQTKQRAQKVSQLLMK